MVDYGIAFVIMGLGVFALVLFQRQFRPGERPYIWVCLVAHFVCPFALLLLTRHYFGGGDIFNYQQLGLWIARLLREDFWQNFPDTLALLFQQQSRFHLHPLGHDATGSMAAITGLLLFVLGDSFYATNVVLSLAAFSGQLAMYLGLRQCFPPDRHKRLLVAILLVPSVVFWSSGVVKEAVALAGLGWLVLATLRFAYGQFGLKHVPLLVLGTLLVALIKAYILLPLLASAGVAYYWRRAQLSGGGIVPAIKPSRLILAILVGWGGILMVGELFPRFAIDNVAEEAARLQGVGQRVDGGSNYEMGDPSQRSLGGQLAFAPWALMSALFRPFAFEARNIMSLINAVETSVFLALFVGLMRPKNRGSLFRIVASSPPILFCITFVVIFGIGVGLATTNMGTLSRYRMPMVPLYAATLLLLQRRAWQGPT